jgi:ribosomal protein S18 acetylase RimI-like enzyme
MPTTAASAAREWSRDGCVVSDDPSRLDRRTVHGFISGSYWAAGIPAATLDRAIDHSLCFGLYRGARQIGFARVVTDRATFGYLCDVYVEESARGSGLGQWLVACVLEHPDLAGLRRLSLMTRDAQGLYQRLGFTPMADPTRYLEIHRPNVYAAPGGSP